MTLDKATIGKEYEVEGIELEIAVKRRLEALGITKHTKVTIINKNRSGSIILMVRGSRLALGKAIAQLIYTKENSNE